MEADFSGYATKAGLLCSDGRTIMPDAFKDQDGVKVPLVWQHGHSEPTNVLGHVMLENRDATHPEGAGVYCYGFFNKTDQGKASKVMVQHGDVTNLSIYANRLVERAKSVLHGAIREVSLVLSGANPGAFIDNVSIAHSDTGSVETLDDEAIIFTDIPLVHSESGADDSDESAESDDSVEHSEAEPTVQEVYDSLNDEQKQLVHFMIGAAVEAASVEHADDAGETTDETDAEGDSDESDSDASDESDDKNDDKKDDKSDDSSDANDDLNHKEGTDEMTRNVFDQSKQDKDAASVEKRTLSHDELMSVQETAEKNGGSLKAAILAHAVEYGIEDIDFLFPDARNVTSEPDVISRRMEWVQSVLGEAKHSPFARIKSMAVDITADEARAKGYVKGTLKKDEIIKLLKRVTIPTTIYKKQKLDRDDIIDITDLDVVAWLKAEMRVMLDEELARAILIGDGREPDDEDKINEDHIRPIAWDDEMYAHQVLLPADVGPDAIVEAVLRARTFYKGTGTPAFYTTDSILTDLILLKDKVGRRLYQNEAELSAALRVSKIVIVEVMEDYDDLLGIVVNIADYTIGADRGGQLGMFDDFDIDYNQYKYLLETRVSGALTKPKSAVVVKRADGTAATPVAPTYNASTHTITIPTTTGVVYQVEGVTVAAGALVITETTEVTAIPASGYQFGHNIDSDWTFPYTP